MDLADLLDSMVLPGSHGSQDRNSLNDVLHFSYSPIDSLAGMIDTLAVAVDIVAGIVAVDIEMVDIAELPEH